ncbi:hypothetical protein BJ944DRAFT_272200 [Cunninghamella echinulata]|nr:hypothetical protein BJ944DRAFT_272200 [Cunninghamella echinulata]
MKYLSLFIFTLWLISMAALAIEPKENITTNNTAVTLPVEPKENTSTNDTSVPLEAGKYYQRCWWTNCYRVSYCPGDAYLKYRRGCGRRYSKSYCCSRDNHHNGGHDGGRHNGGGYHHGHY